jgi:L-seryl-tRNA(Ser) seleniumtransferase
LIHYLKGEALEKIPVWRMISMPLGDIERRAVSWAKALGNLARVVEGETMIGGGSLPGGTLPTRLVAVNGRDGQRNLAQSLAQRLRHGEPALIGRISGDVFLLDPRSVLPEEDDAVLRTLSNAVAGLKR